VQIPPPPEIQINSNNPDSEKTKQKSYSSQAEDACSGRPIELAHCGPALLLVFNAKEIGIKVTRIKWEKKVLTYVHTC
jgi:hypothetical protein